MSQRVIDAACAWVDAETRLYVNDCAHDAPYPARQHFVNRVDEAKKALTEAVAEFRTRRKWTLDEIMRREG